MIARLRELAGKPELRSFAISFAPTLAALVFQLGTFVLMGRSLGAAQFGQLAAAMALTVVVVEVVGLGSGDILVRAIVQRPERFGDYFGNSVWLGLLSLPVCVGAAYLIATQLLHIAIAPLALIVMLATDTLNARVAASVENVFVAHREVIRASFVRLFSAVSRFALAAAVLGFGGVEQVETWIWFTAGYAIVTSALYLAMVVRRYGAPSLHIERAEFGTGVLFSVNQTARAAQGNLDRAMMAAVAQGSLIGAYAAASRVAQLALFPIQIANRLLYPRFFAHGAAGGLAATRKFAIRCAPLQLAIGLACGAGVAVAALKIPALMGEGFAETTAITLGLACALPLMAVQYPAADALTGAGRQGLRTVIFTLATVVFSAGLAAGAKFGGMWGVVAAFVGGHAAIAATLWILLFSLRDTPPTAPAQA
jgi:O-antigen/teichoic acid export membrane protein